MDASRDEILRTLNLLFQPDDTVELRTVGQPSLNGYYHNLRKLADDAFGLNVNFSPQQSVFVCLNPVLPELYARRADQFGRARKGEGASDGEIFFRRWLLIDIDPVRASGVSATNAQKDAAYQLATRVYHYLRNFLGSDCLVCADSGNGMHILVRLPDLPADDNSKWVCEHFLRRLSERFSTSEAKIDRTTYNAARIGCLYGTVKRKGSDIRDQPHRISKILYVPESLTPVDWSRILNVTGRFSETKRRPTELSNRIVAGLDASAVEKLLDEHGIEYLRDDKYRSNSGEIATRFELRTCPWNDAHQDSSAFIILWKNGSIAAGCHHDSCKGKNWPALKVLWRLGENVRAHSKAMPLPQPAQDSPRPSLEIVKGETITAQAVEWIWPGRIALGKMCIIAGIGGVGKTYAVCDLVARVSTGRPGPDGTPLRSGRILLASGEDGLADTLVPRLTAHGADMRQIEFIKGLRSGDELRLLDLLNHIHLLRESLESRPDTVMLVVDPISSFMGDVNTHKASDVRRVLSAVAQLAEDHNVAFVGIHHLRKQSGLAIHAITGSQAFSDAVRTVWLIIADPDCEKRRLMLSTKNNLAETRGAGLAYAIEDGRVAWEPDPIRISADDVLSEDADPTPRQEAEDWLKFFLRHGRQAASDILKRAKDDGIAEKTLRRAKKSLSVASVQDDRAWYWTLPTENEESQTGTTWPPEDDGQSSAPEGIAVDTQTCGHQTA